MLTLKTFPVLAALAAAVFSIGTHVPGKLSFYTPLWEDWDRHIIRWSGYKAPTFSMVFKPETTEELSQGVSIILFLKLISLINPVLTSVIGTVDIFVEQ